MTAVLLKRERLDVLLVEDAERALDVDHLARVMDRDAHVAFGNEAGGLVDEEQRRDDDDLEQERTRRGGSATTAAVHPRASCSRRGVPHRRRSTASDRSSPPPPRRPAELPPPSARSPTIFAQSASSCQNSTVCRQYSFPAWTGPGGFGGQATGGWPQVPSRPVDSARIRTVAAIAGRVLLGLLVAVLLGGAVLVLLAYYADFHSTSKPSSWRYWRRGSSVFLWTRWR